MGFETKVAIDIAGEGFRTTGLMVTERNWLDVYPYATWGGNANLPVFQKDQEFLPLAINLKQVGPAIVLLCPVLASWTHVRCTVACHSLCGRVLHTNFQTVNKITALLSPARSDLADIF